MEPSQRPGCLGGPRRLVLVFSRNHLPASSSRGASELDQLEDKEDFVVCSPAVSSPEVASPTRGDVNLELIAEPRLIERRSKWNILHIDAETRGSRGWSHHWAFFISSLV